LAADIFSIFPSNVKKASTKKRANDGFGYYLIGCLGQR
jgi:hypothetical protein